MRELTRRKFIGIVPAILATSALPARAYENSDDPYTLPALNMSKFPQEVRRTVVTYRTRQFPGTIIIDTADKHLFLVLEGGKAIRYGVAVGKDGYRWGGAADIGRKVMWPRWTPPKDMIERKPELSKWRNGMPGGPENPLGARALYLFQNGRDTLYRIHGTNDPASIGKAASSGCIRMFNQDVVDLYRRAPIGSRVLVYTEGL
ncbi:MAG: L,D-transpeptidase [Alphaproteobacteria bacterium]|nr:L,D-transpeptidase [Alphaproteobacteria bacterium]